MAAATDSSVEQPSINPPPSVSLNKVHDSNRFLLEGEHGNLWFEYRSPTLFVTFDNLATLDDPYPRMPWMYERVEMLGYSILGVQSFSKDWFRQPTSSEQIAALARDGFFSRFDRIVFMGASMGAFGALNFAPFVPGAWVLAFSPQSTMNQKIAPFERRFKYAVKRSNWEEMPFLDAAAAVPYIPKIAMLYDPLEREDIRHAARLDGPNVQRLPVAGSTHQAIRLVVKSDALPQMMREFAETGRLGGEFRQNMQARKQVRSWRRAIVQQLENRNHPKLLLEVCVSFLAEKHYSFAKQARDKVLKEHPHLAASGQGAKK
ncbi:MAG: hypothetical protein ABJ263_04485 [Tateyamaria sp.]|uniref:hypothetical protein n=1 Tax=Tateyamaria sp. TaxID=1929288 RepID=UPI003282F9E9